MKVVYLFPPNFREINAAFRVRGKRILFAYGDKIYNPARVDIPPELIVHEGVHGRRQGSDPDSWWRRYIENPEFRLNEEIVAHRAEYANLCARGRDHELDRLAGRLASPLYGQMITPDRARQLLEAA